MEPVFSITIFCYLLSSTGYVAYLFFQKDWLYKTGFRLMLGGFAIHSLMLVYGYLQSGHMPVSNLHETLSVAGWAVVGVFIFFQARFQFRILGIYAAPLAALVMIVSSQLPKEPTQTRALLESFWLAAHIVSIFIGEASFALACGAGILYLMQERTIKNKSRGFFFRRLPSLELIDTTGYASIVFGFSMLTLGLITGFIYAKSVWGRFWSWDPKEVWSGISWLIYAAMLHGRLTAGWRGRRAAIMSIIGFAILLFTFFGVNFLLKGHHGQFTPI